MSWNQLTVDVPDDLVDAVVGELSGDAVAGVWENESPQSGYTRLVLYFGSRSNLEQIQRHIRTVFSRSGRQDPRIAKKVVACDLDPVAAQVAYANIERNGQNGIWTFCGSLDAVNKDTFQLAMGNLTADLVVDLFPEFDRVLKRHGLAILSGILLDQA